MLSRTESTLILWIHVTWYNIFVVAVIAIAVATEILDVLETRQLRGRNFGMLPDFNAPRSLGCASLCRETLEIQRLSEVIGGGNFEAVLM